MGDRSVLLWDRAGGARTSPQCYQRLPGVPQAEDPRLQSVLFHVRLGAKEHEAMVADLCLVAHPPLGRLTAVYLNRSGGVLLDSEVFYVLDLL